MAVDTAQRAALHEYNESQPRAIYRAHGFKGVHLPKGLCSAARKAALFFIFPQIGHAPLLFFYTAVWNVLLITSLCCSRERRTKLTAYPETRMVRVGYSSGCS